MNFLTRNFSVPICIIVGIYFYEVENNMPIAIACFLIAVFWIAYDNLRR
ncbi:MAG: hypothetical protein VYB68_00345 [Candidatus Neomarinimicrobiota bacterium]|nr:hypothetical protein [Candidatus Neomarinimicrobiota bacterium]